MAGNYGPEIKAAMGDSKLGRLNKSPPKESPADMARDKTRGIKEGSAQDNKLDSMPANMRRPPAAGAPSPQAGPPVGGAPQPIPGVQHATLPHQAFPPDAHHVAAATSIAHAILGKGGM